MIDNMSPLLQMNLVKFPAWPTTLYPPGTYLLSLRWSEWTLAYGFAIDNSTVIIALVLLSVIIIC